MHSRAITLVLVQLSNGCIIPASHKLNADGYFRKRDNNMTEMYHRTVWRQHHGEIPEGYEVDHMCRNRACCNVEHLRCISGQEHTIYGNKNRYKAREQRAQAFWKQAPCSAQAIAAWAGVTRETAKNWIKKWQKN